MWPFKRSKWLGESYDLAVVGLGNPGPEYDGTRHNVGFDCVDKFASEHGLKWTGRRGPLKWAEGRVIIEGSAKRVLLAKPRTFMNLSGEAVRYITTRWSVPEDKLLIIYDDMDLSLGTIRIRMQGSAGGHNGIKSIIRALGTENIPRIRVGIGQGCHWANRSYRPSPRPHLQRGKRSYGPLSLHRLRGHSLHPVQGPGRGHVPVQLAEASSLAAFAAPCYGTTTSIASTSPSSP